MSEIAVSEYRVYPTGYDEATFSDKFSFTITVAWRNEGQWAVCWMGDCLNKRGEWEYESIPSSRTEAFFKRCRFTEDEAKRRALEAVDKLTINGRTFQQADAWVKARIAEGASRG